ncbi:DegT/DnrJ/EryC1/StrS family aminotransferase [Pseudomonas sp. BIGb0427]|uniref:DegT/DnrJ/EryC1/StrS family aminotransferase n=1 Tax=unclassified Pseudomonas TaxID=196821 RepID=UPI0005EB5B6D|nr:MULTISPECIES: DegT/DnrJ/EryC1/StrS family aminotransferase [unclassified Pseudomonas]KJK19542.1 pyridoxal phosphate-dependent aminotransferase [Pseudomonas sp. 2(2015)]NLU58818.1 DegT/DnrJ/EryC1/StrS family aminotransferase [Pseudomonas sp. BIGb0427]QPG63135.1 DegT/DnrJ/EryC1/StrS family aminotransferase [Pseudomonas sp. BIGb0427]QVM98092.1 DegT/DnrJ/EryC1/StrS family aminotransferase [Pseudomonas sp. SORT22]UVL55027.1 DegT/DnrJ/EryC1/StrS family aminotransferase [Pseudomonas sp. B21-035]
MQNTPFLPFALPELGEEEINEVVDTLRSGWVTTGPKAKQFEADFSSFLGGDVESIAVNSATAGLHLALEAIGIGPGDEVILPSYTFTATAEVVRYLGGTPVIVDVLEETFNIDPAAIEAAITDKTRAIMPVHFAGLSCDMDAILQIARRHGLKVVEDAAHALPTTWKGSKIGTLESDITVFSFYANKTMTTGEGGMLVTRNAELAKRCRIMRLHGISRDAFDRYVSKTPAWFYEIVAPGFKYNMSDVAAAMGIHQLRRLEGFQLKRQAMAERYLEALSDLPLVLPPVAAAGDMHAWHLFPLRLRAEANIKRDDFIIKMAELGIGCSVHFIPLHLQPYWRESCALSPEQFPVAQSLFEQEVSIPLYTKMTEADQERVIAAVRSVLANA